MFKNIQKMSKKVQTCPEISKGQLMSKCLFGDFNFFQKTNENTSHSSKSEFVHSFFGRIRGYKKLFRNFLTFRNVQKCQKSPEMSKNVQTCPKKSKNGQNRPKWSRNVQKGAYVLYGWPLRYANRAKNIKNKPKINEDPKDAMLREYQEEIEKLKTLLENQGPDAGKMLKNKFY
jgi:hypothetical protein